MVSSRYFVAGNMTELAMRGYLAFLFCLSTAYHSINHIIMRRMCAKLISYNSIGFLDLAQQLAAAAAASARANIRCIRVAFYLYKTNKIAISPTISILSSRNPGYNRIHLRSPISPISDSDLRISVFLFFFFSNI